jgi:hypothetical protein
MTLRKQLIKNYIKHKSVGYAECHFRSVTHKPLMLIVVMLDVVAPHIKA